MESKPALESRLREAIDTGRGLREMATEIADADYLDIGAPQILEWVDLLHRQVSDRNSMLHVLETVYREP